jgi:hypothetical protein
MVVWQCRLTGLYVLYSMHLVLIGEVGRCPYNHMDASAHISSVNNINTMLFPHECVSVRAFASERVSMHAGRVYVFLFSFSCLV